MEQFWQVVRDRERALIRIGLASVRYGRRFRGLSKELVVIIVRVPS